MALIDRLINWRSRIELSLGELLAGVGATSGRSLTTALETVSKALSDAKLSLT